MDGPTLRLVADGVVVTPRVGGARPAPTRSSVRRGVEHENIAAAALSRDDARLAFAQRVAANLEGGKAAILRADVRKRLLNEGAALRLRPFDANMIIAVAQDAAQRGVMTDSRDVVGLLRFVGGAERSVTPVTLLYLAVFLATLMVAGMAAWVIA